MQWAPSTRTTRRRESRRRRWGEGGGGGMGRESRLDASLSRRRAERCLEGHMNLPVPSPSAERGFRGPMQDLGGVASGPSSRHRSQRSPRPSTCRSRSHRTPAERSRTCAPAASSWSCVDREIPSPPEGLGWRRMTLLSHGNLRVDELVSERPSQLRPRRDEAIPFRTCRGGHKACSGGRHHGLLIREPFAIPGTRGEGNSVKKRAWKGWLAARGR